MGGITFGGAYGISSDITSTGTITSGTTSSGTASSGIAFVGTASSGITASSFGAPSAIAAARSFV